MITYQNGFGSTVLSHYTYSVYADGQRSQSSQTQNGSTTTYLWQYDALNRVTEERLVGVCTYQRIYDLTGNVKTYTATEDGQPSITTNYLYNDQDQLLTETSPAGTISYGYDDNGSLTSKTTSGGTEGYDYDLQGRLRAYTPAAGPSVLYAYDPDGQRIGKTAVTGITEYVVDTYNPTGYSQVLAETTGMTTTCYIHGSDVIGQSVGGASPQYFLYDGHCSVRQLTMSTGLLVGGQDFWYDAWGNELTSNTPLTSYLYCGEQRDGETGLYYLRARMYDPQAGRFLQRDPLRYVDGMNLYEYVGSNSVLTGDPFGLSADIDKCIDKCLTLRSGDGREECLNRCKRRTNENFVLPSFGSVVDNLLAAAIVSNGTSSKSPPIKTPYGEITFSFGAKVETKPCCSDGRKGVLIGASVSVSGKICIGVGGGITKNTLVKNFIAVFDPLQKGDLPCKGSDSGKVTVELSGQAGAIVTGSASVETVILPPSQAWEQNYDVRIDIGLWAGAEVCLGVEGTYKKIRVLN